MNTTRPAEQKQDRTSLANYEAPSFSEGHHSSETRSSKPWSRTWNDRWRKLTEAPKMFQFANELEILTAADGKTIRSVQKKAALSGGFDENTLTLNLRLATAEHEQCANTDQTQADDGRFGHDDREGTQAVQVIWLRIQRACRRNHVCEYSRLAEGTIVSASGPNFIPCTATGGVPDLNLEHYS